MLTTILSQRYIRDATHPGSDHDDGRREATDNISEAGNQADDAIQSEANRGAGDTKPVIQQVRQAKSRFSSAKQNAAPSENVDFWGGRTRVVDLLGIGRTG